MKESSNEPDQSTTSRNDIPLRVARQQMQSARGMSTRMRSKSQPHVISLGYLNDNSQSLTLFAGSSQLYLTEIIKYNDPREIFPKMIDTKYAEIRDQINRGTFRAVLRAKLPYAASLMTARHVLAIKSDEDKGERYKAIYVTG